MNQNKKINIYSVANDYSKTMLYEMIRAEVIISSQSFNQTLAENTKREIVYVLINKRYKLVKVWDVIEYIDFNWESVVMKVENIDLIEMKTTENFIELKCKRN